MAFTVIDTKTGQAPDMWEIALHEEWAQGLIYCDMEGFALADDDTLILMDECGNLRYCPPGRFVVILDSETKRHPLAPIIPADQPQAVVGWASLEAPDILAGLASGKFTLEPAFIQQGGKLIITEFSIVPSNPSRRPA